MAGENGPSRATMRTSIALLLLAILLSSLFLSDWQQDLLAGFCLAMVAAIFCWLYAKRHQRMNHSGSHQVENNVTKE